MPSRGTWTSSSSGSQKHHEIQQDQVQGVTPGSGQPLVSKKAEGRIDQDQPC